MYYLGLDLGQSHDYTALAGVVRERCEDAPCAYPMPLLRRWKLGTTYPQIVADVCQIVATLRERLSERDRGDYAAITLVADKTGVGAPVVDMFRVANPACRLVAVTITGGTAVSHQADEWSVPKRDLVSAAKVLLQSGRLRVAAALPEAPTLQRELLAFRVKISAAGHDSYGNALDWREAANDDLVLATALACWAGEQLPVYRVEVW
jgi:hypothetical protein